MRALGLGWIVLLGLALCCASPRHRVGTDDSQGHWVHGQQLRSLMAELEQANQAAWPQELEGRLPRSTAGMSETLATTARRAELLAETAGHIPATADVQHLSMAERQAFLAIAQSLQQQAGELADFARAGDIAAMHRTRDEINATCGACHQRFRDVAGPM